MLRLTIDTNCINARKKLAALNELEALAAQKVVELVSASAMLDDLDFDKSSLAQARKEKAHRILQGRGALMIGHSMVGGNDVVGGPNIYAYVDDVAAALSDGQPWEALDGNSQRDALHLSTHKVYSFDVFVTLDKGILSCAAKLAALGITVARPEDAVAIAKGTA